MPETYLEYHSTLDHTSDRWHRICLREAVLQLRRIAYVTAEYFDYNSSLLQLLDKLASLLLGESASGREDQISCTIISHPQSSRSAQAAQASD